MSTSLLHLRISPAGDLLVFETPLQVIYTLSGSRRAAFEHNPHLIRWNTISTPHGLACLQWAQESDFDFEVISVREHATIEVPPLLKGLKLSRGDGEQALYLPWNVFPYELASTVAHSKWGTVHLSTPWFLAEEFGPTKTKHYQEMHIPEDYAAAESPRPLPSSLRDPVRDILAWGGFGSYGDFVL